MPTLQSNPARYVVEFTPKELGLVQRAVGYAAGLPVKIKPEDVPLLQELNEGLWKARLRVVEDEKRSILQALQHIEELKENIEK